MSSAIKPKIPNCRFCLTEKALHTTFIFDGKHYIAKAICSKCKIKLNKKS